MYIVETRGLSHHFTRDSPILDSLNLLVPHGSIYGFLGPNGAGKSTTLKLILGLIQPQQGHISLFGQSMLTHRCQLLRHIGSLIESPSIYEHLTAFEHLRLLQKLYQYPTGRIDHVLALVGLENTGTKKARHFSLGMKQRLGIAMALVHNPALLILDEPTNGLDPTGMIEIRALLKQINQAEKTTILLSSHLLTEMEKLVTHVGILHQGQLTFQGPLTELIQRSNQHATLLIKTSQDTSALAILLDKQITARLEEEQLAVSNCSREAVPAINQWLVQGGLEVFELRLRSNDLETIFMDVINQPRHGLHS